jgi:hypothetical protein
MRPVRNVFQKLSRTEQRREGVVAYLCFIPPVRDKELSLCTPILLPVVSSMVQLATNDAKLSAIWNCLYLSKTKNKYFQCM